jgi:hypothetical protein
MECSANRSSPLSLGVVDALSMGSLVRLSVCLCGALGEESVSGLAPDIRHSSVGAFRRTSLLLNNDALDLLTLTKLSQNLILSSYLHKHTYKRKHNTPSTN